MLRQINDWVSTPAIGRFGSIKFYAQTGVLSGGSAWGVSLWGSSLWGSQGSTMKVLRHVLAAGNGTDPDALKGKTLAEIKALVTLSDDDAEDAPDPNP